MRRISLCVIAAAMVAIGLVVWTASTSTPVVPLVGQGVDPFQMMTAITGLLPGEFVDYTFVFV